MKKATTIDIPIHLDGVEYWSIASAARAYNIPVNTVKNRIKRGWEDVDKIFKTKSNETSNIIEVEVDGRKFNTLKGACKYYNKSYHTVHQRINRQGWTLEEALEIVPREKHCGTTITVFGIGYSSIKSAYEAIQPKGKMYSSIVYMLDKGISPDIAFSDYDDDDGYIVDGVDYGSFSNACKHFGVNHRTAWYRRSRCWTPEEIFGIVERCDVGNKYEIDGEVYSTRQLSEKFNIPQWKINERLRKGWTIEESVELTDREDDKPWLVEGTRYRTINDVCLVYDRPLNIVRSRVTHGWTLEEALELVKRPEPPNKKSIILEGVKFESISKALKAYGISNSTYNNRRKKGDYSIEELFGIVPILPPDGQKTKARTVTIDNIIVLRHAYNSEDEKYYECRNIDTDQFEILPRTELYRLYDKVRKKDTRP